LSQAITNKIRHKTRLNISARYKIVINSPEVHLGIKRSHAEVKHKNLIIFIYKNHLDRFITNTKQFIIKDVHSNFVQFLVQKLGMA
jgi:phage gp36-like protein